MSSFRQRKFLFGDENRDVYLQKTYKISLKDYNSLEESQDYRCKICKKSKEDSRFGILCVDHDHETGEIRGLLCEKCNNGLGLFKDSPLSLLRAIQYLKGKL